MYISNILLTGKAEAEYKYNGTVYPLGNVWQLCCRNFKELLLPWESQEKLVVATVTYCSGINGFIVCALYSVVNGATVEFT